MTAQLSRERLEEIKEFGCARIIKPISDEEILALVDIALAGMDINKNARIAESLESLMWPNMAIGNKVIIKAAIDALRAAPPAPVAVPDCFRNAVSALESLYRNGQKQCWNERYTTDMAYASGVLNACRAAMQAEPATAATVPDGWTANADANSALVMLDRIDAVDCADDERIESVKNIIRRLAAAPEQEV